jgi:hypothetical protein
MIELLLRLVTGDADGERRWKSLNLSEREVYQILKGGASASARKSAEKHKHYFILE